MKSAIRIAVRKIIRNKFAWPLLKIFVKIGCYLDFQRNHSDHYQKLSKLFNHLKEKLDNSPVVRHGPFKGMVYPSFDAYGSAMFPKVIGSYEKEIHFIIDNLCQEDFRTIVDIGSAEGYYAVGLAIRMPSAYVHAFDIDKRANDFCSEMAKLNKVNNRISIKSFCSNNTLKEFDFSTKSLIVCDSEGYEKTLFDKDNINNLGRCSLLIEVHDFVNISISGYLEDLFSPTHDILKIKSIDDIEKAKTYSFSETENFSLEEKYLIFRESRPTIMEWFYLTPKQTQRI